jgi:hypothetical protein
MNNPSDQDLADQWLAGFKIRNPMLFADPGAKLLFSPDSLADALKRGFLAGVNAQRTQQIPYAEFVERAQAKPPTPQQVREAVESAPKPAWVQTPPPQTTSNPPPDND